MEAALSLWKKHNGLFLREPYERAWPSTWMTWPVM